MTSIGSPHASPSTSRHTAHTAQQMRRGNAKLPLDQDGFTIIPRSRGRVRSAVTPSAVEAVTASSLLVTRSGVADALWEEEAAGSSSRRRRRVSRRRQLIDRREPTAMGTDSSTNNSSNTDVSCVVAHSRRSERVLAELARERRALVHAQYLAEFMPTLTRHLQDVCDHCAASVSSSMVAHLPAGIAHTPSPSAASPPADCSSRASTSSASTTSAHSPTTDVDSSRPPQLQRVVCVGIGAFGSSHQAAVQLGLLQLVMEQLPVGVCFRFRFRFLSQPLNRTY
jgi:hypothetical protein